MTQPDPNPRPPVGHSVPEMPEHSDPPVTRNHRASQERPAFAVNGFMAFIVLGLATVALLFVGWQLLGTLLTSAAATIGLAPLLILLFPLAGVLLRGFFVVAPNQAVVLTLFGKYIGTVRQNGYFWANPFAGRQDISLRIRNFQSERVKVNDAAGNPVEIAAVIVWRVVDTARASFDVENYNSFVDIQSETALRHLGTAFAYEAYGTDEHGEPVVSLRGRPDEVAQYLREDLQARLALAGVEVLDARISHLAYAPEIASAMLQRQQAEAVLQARQVIVEGAVGMVQMAIERLERDGVVELNTENRAELVNNLLVVLTSERGAQPTLNSGR
ncbi:SPFH domain-containing protein [Deinococcus radiophilus]|uniref:SPFH domain-containing protein n=2 Tax=Deinococcus radiophilus TaxID=32062 RepID=A0A3S0KGC0_9DEIO|nr:SPFH domain-containing protein [Deinococcus radiophilus]RTR26121.1 SPFH domain-containing protein [Deinococcus radiophilus]UFA51601.1 SPFH domain-containing protein [Deinococcus radiophilus]